MTLIIGARCMDGVVLAADRRRLSRHEKGPSVTKLFKISCGAVLAGAGDDAVLNEARVFIDRRIKDCQTVRKISTLTEVVEITADVVNDLVNCYRNTIEESFGYVLCAPENLDHGNARLHTIYGAGFLDTSSVCLGSGSSYARPLVELLLGDGKLRTDEAIKMLPAIFTLVSNVQTAVGDGIDICIINDKEGIREIIHADEVGLKPLRLAILEVTGIRGTG